MTNETALRAKELVENIAALKRYRDNTSHVKNFEGGLIQVFPYGDIYSGGARSLREEFLPISTKDLMFMYLSKVDEQITSLEKELEAL